MFPGVCAHQDDILVFGEDQCEHVVRLELVFKQLIKCGAALNREKCSFSKTRIKYLGHIIDQDGIRSGNEMLSAYTPNAHS